MKRDSLGWGVLRGSFLEEGGEDFDGPDNVGDGAATREVGDGVVETLEDGAGDGEASELFEDFVDEIARIEVGGDEDVGLAGDLVSFRAELIKGAFVKADARVNGSIELHFSSNKNIAIIESSKSFLDDVDGGIFASTAKGREGEEGDARLAGEEFLSREVGLFDDFSELLRGWVLAGSYIREKVKLGIATHDDEAGKSVIRQVCRGIERHGEVVTAGEDDVAS